MSNLKNQRFGLVLSQEEKIAIGRLAELEGGLTQAALIRCLIREAAQKKGVWSSSEESFNKSSKMELTHADDD